MTIFILASSFILLILLGMPIAFAVGFSSLLAIFTLDIPLVLIPHTMFSGVDSFVLCAIPLFVLVGEVMSFSGMTRSLMNLADIIVGKIRGGLGHTNIAASMFFAGITGSATADTTAIGSILIPAMTEKGYSRAFSTAVTISSSIIGPILPPSLTFVIYALVVGNVSIGGLFLAGIIPGILTGIGLMAITYIISLKRNYPKRTRKFTWGEIYITIKKSLVVLVMPVIIVAGVVCGAYTATESAAVASAYAFIIAFFVSKKMQFKDIGPILFRTAKTSSIMFLLLATSNVFSYVLTIENIPTFLASTLQDFTSSPYVFIIILNITLLAIGCIIDLFPAIFIFAPIFAPIADAYGIDPLHFGVLFCVNLLVGLNTPPVGSGLFIGSAIGKVSMEKLISEIIPFIILQLFVVLLISYIPYISLAIPNYFNF